MIKKKYVVGTTTKKTIHLNVDECQVKPQFTDKSKFLARAILARQDIYIAKENRGKAKNTIRAGGITDTAHVDDLIASIDIHGILYDRPLPVVYKEPIFEDGRWYEFQLKSIGNHRDEAFENLGITHWIYDIYEPVKDKWDMEDIGWDSNNPKGQLKPLNKASMILSLTKMVEGNRWPNLSQIDLEIKLGEYIDSHATINSKTKGSIVKQVLHASNTSFDHREYLPEQATLWLEKNLGVQVNGTLDPITESYHWAVGEGYEEKKIMKGILKYGETKKPSKYYLHTKQPLMTSKSRPSKGTTNLKRKSMVDTFKFITYSLDQIFEYKKKHGCYPFEIVGFLPQDQKDGEDMIKLIPYDSKVVSLKKVA
jgi:hypothetical protein